jgi:hypothetical protein
MYSSTYVCVILEILGGKMKQSVILEILELNTFQKGQATNGVKQA